MLVAVASELVPARELHGLSRNLHCLMAFVFNASLVGLTVNVAAGLL